MKRKIMKNILGLILMFSMLISPAYANEIGSVQEGQTDENINLENRSASTAGLVRFETPEKGTEKAAEYGYYLLSYEGERTSADGAYYYSIGSRFTVKAVEPNISYWTLLVVEESSTSYFAAFTGEGDTITIEVNQDMADMATPYGYLLYPEPSMDNEPVRPSQDSVEDFVARLYENILQRPADESGLTSWTEVLKSGKESGAKVVQGFVDSDEFKNRSLSDEDYIKIMYRTFLGREYDQGGLDTWKGVLDSGLSRMHVFKGFAESDEFTKICSSYGIIRGNAVLTAPMDQNEGVTKVVARCYNLCLGRKADTEGINGWCSQILSRTNTAKQVAYGFVFSDEFKSKNLSDEEYVKTLYRVFMDREADGDGLASWVKVLAQGQSREHVFNGFADSVEFREICTEYGIN